MSVFLGGSLHSPTQLSEKIPGSTALPEAAAALCSSGHMLWTGWNNEEGETQRQFFFDLFF